MRYRFVKLHGLGNDFVFIDGMDGIQDPTPEDVRKICDRHFGIGADGVVVVKPSPRPECRAYMHYINSDGTLAEMCGNGVRCFTKFLVDNGYLPAEDGQYVADTLRGPLPIRYSVDEAGCMEQATVDMDAPIFEPDLVPVNLPANGTTPGGQALVMDAEIPSPWGAFAFTCVSMGNPHAVTFIDDFSSLPDELFVSDEKSLATLDLEKIGAFYESNCTFPAKANIEFAHVEPDGIAMRVFERGCGETLACGTGACATLVAATVTGRCDGESDVILRGGPLHIRWDEPGSVFMTGPARETFRGAFDTTQVG